MNWKTVVALIIFGLAVRAFPWRRLPCDVTGRHEVQNIQRLPNLGD